MRASRHGGHVMGLVEHEQVLVTVDDRQLRLGDVLLAQLPVEPQLVLRADGGICGPGAAVRVHDLAPDESCIQRRRLRHRERGEAFEQRLEGGTSLGRVARDPPAHGVQSLALGQGRRPTAGATTGSSSRLLAHSPHTAKVRTLWAV